MIRAIIAVLIALCALTSGAQAQSNPGFANVRSGANGCTAAAGNGSTDDTSAISCQITYVVNNFGGGIVYFPCGSYKISATLDVAAPVILKGSGRGCTFVETGTNDIIAFNFYNTTTQQQGGGIRDMFIGCYQNAASTQPCIEIDDFVGLTLAHYVIFGGCYALFFDGSRGGIAGGDNSSIDAELTAYGTGSSCSSLYIYNSGDWFVDSKIDTVGQTTSWAVQILTDTNSLSSVFESHFDGHVDMSGSYTSGSFNLGDGGASRSTVVMVHPIFGGSGGFGTLARFNTLSIIGGELGEGTVTDNDSTGGILNVAGSMAGNGVSGQTVTFSGTHLTRHCGTSNSGVSC